MVIFLKDSAAAGLSASSWAVELVHDEGLAVVAEAVSAPRCAATLEGGRPRHRLSPDQPGQLE